jgi:hypothetical protein
MECESLCSTLFGCESGLDNVQSEWPNWGERMLAQIRPSTTTKHERDSNCRRKDPLRNSGFRRSPGILFPQKETDLIEANTRSPRRCDRGNCHWSGGIYHLGFDILGWLSTWTSEGQKRCPPKYPTEKRYEAKRGTATAWERCHQRWLAVRRE